MPDMAGFRVQSVNPFAGPRVNPPFEVGDDAQNTVAGHSASSIVSFHAEFFGRAVFDSGESVSRSHPQPFPLGQQRQNRAAGNAIALLKIPETVPIVAVQAANPEPHPYISLRVLG